MKQLLTKAVLVTLAVTSIGSVGGIAEAGANEKPSKRPTATCGTDPATCTTVAAKGIRW